jgi:hypothetical protein
MTQPTAGGICKTTAAGTTGTEWPCGVRISQRAYPPAGRSEWTLSRATDGVSFPLAALHSKPGRTGPRSRRSARPTD